MNKSNTALIIVAVILIVGIVGVVIWRSSGQSSMPTSYDSSDSGAPLESTGSESINSTENQATSTPASSSTNKPTTSKPKPSPVYDATLTSYRDSGYLIQFVDCQTTPMKAMLNIKTGSKFAIQNVDSDSHVFTFGDKTYNLASNAYAVLTTPAIGGWPITCDKINRAVVNSQK